MNSTLDLTHRVAGIAQPIQIVHWCGLEFTVSEITFEPGPLEESPARSSQHNFLSQAEECSGKSSETVTKVEDW